MKNGTNLLLIALIALVGYMAFKDQLPWGGGKLAAPTTSNPNGGQTSGSAGPADLVNALTNAAVSIFNAVKPAPQSAPATT